MAQSDKDKNDSLINVETDCTNDVKKIETIPKKLLLAGEQWSQEENCIVDDTQHINNCHDLTLVKDNSSQSFMQNNNFIGGKSNLSCLDDKYCFYHKFPLKVNNNIYQEAIPLMKDGMEEYFEQNATGIAIGKSPVVNGCSLLEFDGSSVSQNFQDQINALNGDDDDEDNGCIYTYKGDNYESNLSQLLDTCFSCGLPTSVRSTPPYGAVSIQRILNGSSRVKSNQKGSLYSPEMDFLEMDFDPGSCGDGADSECEDNNVINIDTESADMTIPDNSIEVQVSDKGSNIQNIRSLMCRRCEMCSYNEQKVNNISDSSINKTNKSEINPDVVDICKKESNSEAHKDISNLESHNNYDCNSFKPHVTSNFINLSLCEDNIDKESIENNLNFMEEYEKFSDEGEFADDERDDCVSEHYDTRSCSDAKNSLNTLISPKEDNNCHSNTLHNVKNQGSSVTNESNVNYTMENCNSKCFGPVNCSTDDNVKVCNNSHKINNNLGSISAPEVSPTKEYSCVDKFTRSFSFHNQLSSPKYENVCISNRHKENIPNCGLGRYPDCEGCSCSCNSVSHELEACADRLSQRVKSVFNVGAILYNNHSTNSNFKNIDTCNTNGPVAVTMVTNHYMPSVCPSSSINDSELPPSVISLPGKTIPHKTKDPNSDPNTTSKECYDNVPAGLTSTVEKVMIWTEYQAAYRQVVQVDTSACGATAVLNVLLALDQARTVNEVTQAVKTRQRAENAPIVEYLFSRSNAGATHEDLLRGVKEISNGSIVSRFFHMFPQRSFQLLRWLSHWIKKGGVPVATLNLQVGVYPRQIVPDAWHHQMVFGVGPLGVYLTNPLECVTVTLLSEQLCSSSVLLVRRSDLVSRWDNKDKLIELSLHSDTRWNDMNVLGQVVGVLKEESSPEKFQGRRHLTSHVSIPAAYQSGVTIFMRSDNANVEELKSVSELPLLDEDLV